MQKWDKMVFWINPQTMVLMYFQKGGHILETNSSCERPFVALLLSVLDLLFITACYYYFHFQHWKTPKNKKINIKKNTKNQATKNILENNYDKHIMLPLSNVSIFNCPRSSWFDAQRFYVQLLYKHYFITSCASGDHLWLLYKATWYLKILMSISEI